MAKKRVYDLAKLYGMEGPDLAKKLQELGFDKVKSHMAVLDDFDLMMVQARLEASGIIPEAVEAPPASKEKSPAKAQDTIADEKSAKKKTTKTSKPAKTAKKKTTKKTTETAAEPALAEQVSATLESKETKETTEKTALSEVSPTAPEQELGKKTEPLTQKAPAKEAAKPLQITRPKPPKRTATILGRIDPNLLKEKTIPKKTEKKPEPTVPSAAKPSTERTRPLTTKERDELEEKAAKLKKVKKYAEQSSNDFEEILDEVHPTFSHDPRSTLSRGDVASRDKLTTAQLIEREEVRYRRGRDMRRARKATREEGARKPSSTPITVERKSKVILQPPVTVKSFAMALGLKPNSVISKLMNNSVMATMNSALDNETIELLALDFGQEVEVRKQIDVEEKLKETIEESKDQDDQGTTPRPPVIAFLGHVDHGKTSLLDAIRLSNVTQGEAGGITQHIGAYQVTTKSGHKITILDTPGHEAFTAMRARGAQTTDIVILVVAADDGVMPQTAEAISHAKAAGVPIIIALNKIDKADANPQKVRQQLAGAELASEDWGGSTGIVETSATKKIGIDALLERVHLEAEILELKGNPNHTATGTVLEACVSEGRGIVANLLVQNGTLKIGDVILAGTGYGKVRNIYNDRGEALEEAGPSTPVEVTGLSVLPEASDKFYVVPNLNQAREVAEERARKRREFARSERPAISLENLFDQIKSGQMKEVRIILKADVQGSLEALKKELEKLKEKEIGLKILHAASGGINESDVDLARSTDAILIGFNVIADEKARQWASTHKVEIRTYQIIYELVDDLKKAMEGLLKPKMREDVTGHAAIRQVFRTSKFGNIAGCMVTDGAIARNNGVRLIRDSVIIFTGKLASLKRVKDDVREVKEGFECGIKIADYEDIKEGDVIESYKITEEKRTLV